MESITLFVDFTCWLGLLDSQICWVYPPNLIWNIKKTQVINPNGVHDPIRRLHMLTRVTWFTDLIGLPTKPDMFVFLVFDTLICFIDFSYFILQHTSWFIFYALYRIITILIKTSILGLMLHFVNIYFLSCN